MAKLSKRQREIVTALTSGESQKVIAQRLGISHGTVRKHLYDARTRTHCRTSLELAYKVHGELLKK